MGYIILKVLWTKQRIDDIEQLSEEEKNHLFYLIDNLVKASKLKAL